MPQIFLDDVDLTLWPGIATNGADILVGCIGGGGAGLKPGTHIPTGGGGGAFASKTVPYVSGTSVSIQIGRGGITNGAAGTDTVWDSGVVVAKGGAGATDGAGGAGGSGAACTPAGNSGGDGGGVGADASHGAGGGGAGGPGGPGRNGGVGGAAAFNGGGAGGGGAGGGSATAGGASTASDPSGAGGLGPTGTAGGAGSSVAGDGNPGSNGSGGGGTHLTGGRAGAGGAGQEWDATHGAGGGGGAGAGGGFATDIGFGGHGGLYGGGGGGSGWNAGTPSDAWGNGANGLIVITYTAPLDDGLFVNGEEHDPLLETFQISKSLNAIDTLYAEFDSDGESPIFRPIPDDEVRYIEDGAALFGGYAMGVKESRLGGEGEEATDNLVVGLDASDNNVIARWKRVHGDRPAESLKDRAAWLFAFASGYGVTFDTGMDTGPTVPTRSYVYTALQEALAEQVTLTAEAGDPYYWRIDADKLAWFYQVGTESAPFDLIEGDTRLLGDITVDEQRTDTYANYVIVLGSAAAVASHGFLGTTGNFSNLEEIVLGGTTYVFQTVLTNVAGHVLIGATELDSLNNWIAAVQGDPGGSGTAYAAATVANASATAYLFDPGNKNDVKAEALTPGAAGNSIVCTTTGVNAEWHGEGDIPIGSLQLGSDIAPGGLVGIADGQGSPADPTKLREYKEDAFDLLTQAEVDARAAALLVEKMAGQKTIHWMTFETGFEPGQVHHVTSSKRNIDGDFLITDVLIRYYEGRAPVGAGDSLVREITAVGGVIAKGSWEEVLKQWSGVAA
jgi:hypothetical protein